MRMSNAIRINELIFLLLVITNLKIVSAWSGGKYFSEYEYPEIQMLFSCKEEPKGKEGRNIGHVQDKKDFSLPVVDETVAVHGRGVMKSSENRERPKPWMRGPYTNEVKIESDSEKENYSLKTWNHSEERDGDGKNTHMAKTPINGDVAKPFPSSNERARNSGIADKNNGRFNEKGTVVEPETRMHKPMKKGMKNQSREKPISFNEGNKRAKFTNVKSGLMDDYPNYQRQNVFHDINRSQGLSRQFKTKNKVNENFYSGAFKSPDYEGTFQEYEEVANGKNEAVYLNENVVSSSEASNKNLIPSKTDGLSISNKNMVAMQANVIPSKSESILQPEFTVGIVNYKSTDSILDMSSMTPAFALPVEGVMNIIESNASKAKVKLLSDKDMVVQQPNRGSALNQNSQLLAKPPIKIANTLIEKHGEDENENVGVIQHRTQMVKMTMITGTPPSTAQLMVAGSPRPASGIVPEKEHRNPGENFFFLSRHDPLQKCKRNTNETNSFLSHRHNSNAISSLEKEVSLGQERNIASTNIKRSVLKDGTSRSSKVNEVQYYSLSQSSSPYSKFSSFISRLKPNLMYKNKKDYKDKASGSLKRSVPETYEQEYEAEYDDYINKDNRKDVPLQAYDYDNQYDMDYNNNKDYSRMNRVNNRTELTDAKEITDYNDQRNEIENKFQKNRRKIKKQNSLKVDENYNDIFAHPIALDDPELQIVRNVEGEMDSPLQHRKNYGTKRRKVKMAGGNENYPQSQFVNDDEPPVKIFPNRKRLRNKKGEFIQQSRHNKLQNDNKETFHENEISRSKCRE